MSQYDDRLKDYVDVKERVRLFYERYPDGRLVTAKVKVTREPDDTPRVWVKALAYRTPDDAHPAPGWSWMVLPGSTPYTKGSEIENTETSAWGRAIGALGIGIDKSIASADEVRAKEVRADVEHGDDGSLIGEVQVGDMSSSDFLVRQTPDGSALGFRLRGAKGGILVKTAGRLAEQLFDAREAVVGKRVTVWGRIGEESFTPNKPGAKKVTYQVLAADRVRVPEVGDLPRARRTARGRAGSRHGGRLHPAVRRRRAGRHRRGAGRGMSELRAPQPLTPAEEAIYREALPNIPSFDTVEAISSVEATRREWAERCRRLLATLDAAAFGAGGAEREPGLWEAKNALDLIEISHSASDGRPAMPREDSWRGYVWRLASEGCREGQARGCITAERRP